MRMERGAATPTVEAEVKDDSSRDFNATLRFLKAKIKVVEEDSAKLLNCNHDLIAENAQLMAKLKVFQQNESNNKDQVDAHQKELQQLRQQYEESSAHVVRLEAKCVSLLRDLEMQKKSQKLELNTKNSVELKLNGALNQLNEYKQQLQKYQQSNQDTSLEDKKKIEELTMENRRLAKQKNELLLGFNKQMKLIDILKRQKMHLKAATLLEFSEEEFKKIVGWEGD